MTSHLKQFIRFILFFIPLICIALNAEAIQQIEPSSRLQIQPDRRESFNISVPDRGIVELYFESINSEANLAISEIRLSLKCESEALLIQGRKQEKIFDTEIVIYNSAINKQKTFLSLQDSSNSCQLKYDSNIYSIVPESKKHKPISDLRIAQKSVFDGEYPLNTRILKDPYLSLSARFKALFGRELTRVEYEQKNPRMKIDLTNAPKLDLLVINTLQISNDFVGNIMMRGLEHHARQGTKIYFMTTKSLLYQKDSSIILQFTEKFPDASVVIYEKKPETFQMQDILGMLHRTNHVKVMMTYSEKNPQFNSFIAGGRNLSELYFYKSRPDNTMYPEIIQWNEDIGYGWVYFDDLDFEIKNNKYFKNFALNLIHFNERQFLINEKNEMHADQNGSHIYSYPFGNTQNQLEQNYIDMINSSKKSIFIISPYLNFTSRIKKSLDQARHRGVEVRIYTNLTVEGDFMPVIMGPAALSAIRKIVDEYQIYYYTNPASILHVKAVMIDQEKLILGSVNMNRRSFVHDTEFSILITEKSVIKDFNQQMDSLVTPFMERLKLDSMPNKSVFEFLIKPILPLM
jgi:hypothetical protein